MDISQYIEPGLYVLIPVLYLFGIMIRKSKIDNKWIPCILGVMGVALSVSYLIAGNPPKDTADFFSIFFAGVTQGILCASGSVYANNLLKQALKGKTDDTDGKSNDETTKGDGGNEGSDSGDS